VPGRLQQLLDWQNRPQPGPGAADQPGRGQGEAARTK
jgi:hypothetical protein